IDIEAALLAVVGADGLNLDRVIALLHVGVNVVEVGVGKGGDFAGFFDSVVVLVVNDFNGIVRGIIVDGNRVLSIGAGDLERGASVAVVEQAHRAEQAAALEGFNGGKSGV